MRMADSSASRCLSPFSTPTDTLLVYADNSTVGGSEVAKLDVYDWFEKTDDPGKWEYRKAPREDESSKNWINDSRLDQDNTQEPFRLVGVVTALGEKMCIRDSQSSFQYPNGLFFTIPNKTGLFSPYSLIINGINKISLPAK